MLISQPNHPDLQEIQSFDYPDNLISIEPSMVSDTLAVQLPELNNSALPTTGNDDKKTNLNGVQAKRAVQNEAPALYLSKSETYSSEVTKSVTKCARPISNKLRIQCRAHTTVSYDVHGDADDWLQKMHYYSALQTAGAINFGELDKKQECGLILTLEKAILEEISVNSSDPCFGSIYLIYDNFKTFFDEIKTIGQGVSAIVKKCKQKSTFAAKEVAVKIADYLGDEERLLQTIRSFKLKKGLKHRNVIKAEALYIDLCKKKTYMIVELVEGQNLMEILSKMKRFEEPEAVKIFRSILLGAQYLHRHGVCHRDLKLENILIDDKSQKIKITDLGISKSFKEHAFSDFKKNNYKMWTFTGTIACLPPEVFKDLEYSESVDSWGAGVILYTLLVGSLPYFEEYQDDLIESILNRNYKTDCSEYKNLSQDAKHLISCLLEKDPKKRYTLFEALSHPWVNSYIKKPKEVIFLE